MFLRSRYATGTVRYHGKLFVSWRETITQYWCFCPSHTLVSSSFIYSLSLFTFVCRSVIFYFAWRIGTCPIMYTLLITFQYFMHDHTRSLSHRLIIGLHEKGWLHRTVIQNDHGRFGMWVMLILTSLYDANTVKWETLTRPTTGPALIDCPAQIRNMNQVLIDCPAQIR